MESLVSLAQVFMLSLARIAAFLVMVPLLGTRMVPAPIKVTLSLCLAAFLFHWNVSSVTAHALNWPLFLALLLKETLVGWLMGILIFLLLAALQAAGEWVGFQMMFSAATTFSMLNMEQNTVTGNLFSIISVLVFIMVDGHHALVGALDLSFQVLPVVRFPHTFGPMHSWIQILGRIFEISLKLSMPIMAALFISNVILGMIAKTMPQINIFVIGMPVQIVLGFIILTMMLMGLITAESGLFRQWAHELKGFVHILAP